MDTTDTGGAKPERTLDLDALTFGAGAHLMSNKKCELPDQSWRKQEKGYEALCLVQREHDDNVEDMQNLLVRPHRPDFNQP